MSTLTHKTTLLLSPEEHRFLLDYSRKNGRTMGELIREAIRKVYLKTLKKKSSRGWEVLFRAKAPVADWADMEKEIIRGRLQK